MLLLRAFPSIVLVATGSVTLANSRISAVANTAFVDFSVANVLTDYANGYHYLILYDSTMKAINGYIKAAGTGETYGSELCGNPDFSTDTWWNKSAACTIHDGEGYFDGSAGSQAFYKNPSVTAGMLYKISCALTLRTTGTFMVIFNGVEGNSLTAPGTSSAYSVRTSGDGFFYISGSSLNGTVDNASFKQVLTPATTGVTIVSAAGGATQSWTSQTLGFDPNDASGFTYQIYRVRR
jgi:hypothetical protein